MSGILSVGSCLTPRRSLVEVMRIQVRGLLSENVAVDCYHANATLLFTEFMVSVSKRQAFSSRFSRKFHECLPRGRKSPLADFTGGLRTYATINSALGNGHAEPVGIGRLPIHDPHVPIRLKSEKHDYVPPPAPDYTTSVLDRLFDFLGSQGPGVDGCWPKMYWYTV